MVRADYQIVEVTGDTVYLIDTNLGKVSVTNDAEAVYAAVSQTYPNREIVYRDGEGEWCEIYYQGGYIAWRPHEGI